MLPWICILDCWKNQASQKHSLWKYVFHPEKRQKLLLFWIYIYLNLKCKQSTNFLFYLISLRPLTLSHLYSITPLSSTTPFVILPKAPLPPTNHGTHIHILKPSAFLFYCTFPTNLQQRINYYKTLPSLLYYSWLMRPEGGKNDTTTFILCNLSWDLKAIHEYLYPVEQALFSPHQRNFQSFLPALYHIHIPPLNWVVE